MENSPKPIDQSDDPWMEGIGKEVKDIEENQLKNFLLSDQDLINLDLSPIKWLYPHLIPNPGLVAFAGKPGSYKTFFAQWLSRRLASGKCLFDKDESSNVFLNSVAPEPTPVLFVEEEMSLRQMRDRSIILKREEESNFYHLTSAGFNLKDPSHMKQLKLILREHGIKVLILDPFTSVSRMRDENSNSEAAMVMDVIRHELVHDKELAMTVIFIHHPAKNAHGKDTNLRGAGDILGKCDMALTFEPHEGTSKVTIHYKKSRDLAYDDMRPFTIELRKMEESDPLKRDLIGDQLEWVLTESEAAPDSKHEVMKAEVLEILEAELKGLTRKEISSILGVTSSNGTFARAWAELKDSKQIRYEDKKFHFNNSSI